MTTQNPDLTPEQQELVKAAIREQERQRKKDHGAKERQKRAQSDLSKPPSDGTARDHEFDWSW